MYLVQSLWRDEAYSFLLAKRGVLDIITMTAKDFSPPFYYLLLHFWIIPFGKSEIALRSLSLIFYWATLYVAFMFLSEIFKMNLKKSFLYLIFFAVNPLLVYFAFEARMYSLFAFLATLSYYSLYKKNTKLYLISTILALYTHYFMLFVVLGQYLIIRFKQKQALMAFAPWMLFVLLSRLTSSSSFWIGKMSLSNFVTFIGEVFTGYESSFGFFEKQLGFLSWSILAVVAYGMFKRHRDNKKNKKLFDLLAVWGVGIPLFILLISFIKPIFLPRYLIFSTVGLILLMVYAFEKMPVYVKIFAVVFFFVFSLNFNKLQIANRTKAPLRQSLSEIKNLMNSNDFVYVMSELDFFTAQYYLGDDRVYIYGKNYEEIPDYIGKVLVGKDRIKNQLPIYPIKAYVINHDGSYDIQALY